MVRCVATVGVANPSRGCPDNWSSDNCGPTLQYTFPPHGTSPLSLPTQKVRSLYIHRFCVIPAGETGKPCREFPGARPACRGIPETPADSIDSIVTRQNTLPHHSSHLIPTMFYWITPHQKSSMNQCIFSSLSCFIACMQGCHSIHQMANLTNVAKMEFDPTPTYRPITPRYLIRISSFKIWWHDNMLTYAHTKYWIGCSWRAAESVFSLPMWCSQYSGLRVSRHADSGAPTYSSRCGLWSWTPYTGEKSGPLFSSSYDVIRNWHPCPPSRKSGDAPECGRSWWTSKGPSRDKSGTPGRSHPRPNHQHEETHPSDEGVRGTVGKGHPASSPPKDKLDDWLSMSMGAALDDWPPSGVDTTGRDRIADEQSTDPVDDRVVKWSM